MRVDAGHQKSMTSVENRDPVRKYSPGSGELVAKSEVAKLTMRAEAGCQEEDGRGGRNGYTEGRRKKTGRIPGRCCSWNIEEGAVDTTIPGSRLNT